MGTDQGRLEFEPERPRGSVAAGSEGAFPGTAAVVGGELEPFPELHRC